MVTAKLFSFQVCMCRIEPVFFNVADEKKGKGRILVGFFPWWDLMSHQYSGICSNEGLPGLGWLRPRRGK